MDIVSLNHRLLPASEATLSCDDRGFRFGDGVFETISLHHGVPYLLEYHMERLTEGLKALGLTYDVTALPGAIAQLIEANHLRRAIVRVAISRGAGSQGYLPLPTALPTVLIQPLPVPAPPEGKASLFLSSWEKISPRALPTRCKLAQGLNATLARMEAKRHDCYEAVQCSAEGFLSEASSANLFWCKDDTIFTPSLSTGALAGVIRRRLIHDALFRIEEGEFMPAELEKADSVFLTNASLGIVEAGSLMPKGLHWAGSSLTDKLKTWLEADRETICRGTCP